MRLILASSSPRRKELLSLLKIPFEVMTSDFSEHRDSERDVDPARQTVQFAGGKAEAVAGKFPDALVIASDTSIEQSGQLLGKPHSAEEARAMLACLQGREHLVHSAVALRSVGRGIQQEGIETVRIKMKGLSVADRDRYLATGDWRDKAGSYAIQGRGGELIERIEGDYTAVVGLPLRLVARLLAPYVQLPVDVESVYRSMPYPNWSRFSVPTARTHR